MVVALLKAYASGSIDGWAGVSRMRMLWAMDLSIIARFYDQYKRALTLDPNGTSSRHGSS
jgi:hypothetical protein